MSHHRRPIISRVLWAVELRSGESSCRSGCADDLHRRDTPTALSQPSLVYRARTPLHVCPDSRPGAGYPSGSLPRLYGTSEW